MTRLLSFCSLLFAISAAQAASAPDMALLPPNGFLNGWNRSENHRVFTASDLYGHIDGGAEIFLEFGFEQLTLQRYAPAETKAADQPGGELKVEIYRMTDPTAAAGIYLMNCGKESKDPTFAERHCLSKYQLIFKRDRYYVVIDNTTGNKAFQKTMLDFARHIAGRLPAEITQLLPKDGLIDSSLRLLRGPYGLQAIFTLGEGDILQLGRKITAVSGRYRDANGKYSLILADYPTAAAAEKAFDHLRTNLDKNLTVQEKSEGRLVFKDYDDKFGLLSVSGKRISIKVHLASPPRSHNAPDNPAHGKGQFGEPEFVNRSSAQSHFACFCHNWLVSAEQPLLGKELTRST